jgi:hypothetical protein
VQSFSVFADRVEDVMSGSGDALGLHIAASRVDAIGCVENYLLAAVS